jgi:hypothetical protein
VAVVSEGLLAQPLLFNGDRSTCCRRIPTDDVDNSSLRNTWWWVRLMCCGGDGNLIKVVSTWMKKCREGFCDTRR